MELTLQNIDEILIEEILEEIFEKLKEIIQKICEEIRKFFKIFVESLVKIPKKQRNCILNMIIYYCSIVAGKSNIWRIMHGIPIYRY